MNTTAKKSQSWIEKRPDYWRGRASVRLMCAKEADRNDDQVNHTRHAAEYEAIAAKLERPSV